MATGGVSRDGGWQGSPSQSRVVPHREPGGWSPSAPAQGGGDDRTWVTVDMTGGMEMGRPFRSLELGALGDHNEVGTPIVLGERGDRGQFLSGNAQDLLMPFLPMPYLTPQIPSGRAELDLRLPEHTGGMYGPARGVIGDLREPLIPVIQEGRVGQEVDTSTPLTVSERRVTPRGVLGENILMDRTGREGPGRGYPRRPCIFPEKYAGKTGFDDYLKQFEVVAQINCWVEEEKRIYLLAILQGRVQEFTNDLPDSVRGKFGKLAEALLLQFGAHKLVEGYRQELYTCQQGRDETFRELGVRTRRLVSRAFPESSFVCRESLSIHHFVQAIRDAAIRVQVKRSSPSDLEKAIEGAMREADIQAGEKFKTGRVHAVSGRGETEGPVGDGGLVAKLEKQLSELRVEVERSHKGGRTVMDKGLTCWYCSEGGHMKSSCAKFQRESPQLFAEFRNRRAGKSAPQQVNQKETSRKSEN